MLRAFLFAFATKYSFRRGCFGVQLGINTGFAKPELRKSPRHCLCPHRQFLYPTLVQSIFFGGLYHKLQFIAGDFGAWCSSQLREADIAPPLPVRTQARAGPKR